MLRGAVIGLGVGLAVLSLLALVTGTFPPAFVLGFWAVLILVGTVWEKTRYKPLEPGRPGPGWTATPERFVDPETGVPVAVYMNTAGERRYVQE